MSDVESEVRAFLDNWTAAYEAKDVDALVAMAVGDEMMLVGTGADEVRFGLDGYRAQAERDTSQAEALKATMGDLHVSGFGDTAFAYGEASIQATVGGELIVMAGLRATFGLVRTADGWKLAQMHLSAPADQQSEGSSF